MIASHSDIFGVDMVFRVVSRRNPIEEKNCLCFSTLAQAKTKP